ncbi:MAG: Excinuclease ABC subunit C [Candidatus Moranbacteria bacterium GW2011_GWE2_35_2-]|nr:MAG: Excinuclease ABC subunit C [Candidatus Moranbacteria bacterium GW2011_GWE2_35_2-]KKQ06341.1 MAG: Excinuclease ABC subunit C [Candidatus Moranbacteria bacterium GW2011_GWF1_36_4]KKQ22218.1 MAG: Excinuclease ABC subunit C [Candidatus Moranbacteria bacterium GW2011_GWF2_37_11]KKQ28726.1 MAG: Excinuclease ABC subunit C [Candidatus Moranbacteria bacterium GW2011_GWD1_37_17]KKQ30290.1 MAG: Excinuclease ABC subunit C [Candidatus Moranbacteria bacterium GW2011_GWE1_37_24]KKQ46934.1 MAG: Excinu
MLKNKIKNFPDAPGVYIFFNAKKIIIYIGKATSLKSRVGSYFVPSPQPSPGGRGGGLRPIEEMIHQVSNIKIIETESVLDALILESNLIKKHQPKYNILGKDDKSFSYFVITKENYPKVLIKRKTDIQNIQRSMSDVQKLYGPYTSKKQMEIALKIIRKIFPFHNRNEKSEKGCLDFQIGMCPGPYAGAISKKDYVKNISGIKMILEGKRKNLVKKLEKEMDNFSKKEEFEKADEIKRKLFALKHIQDVALISEKDDNFQINSKFIRIEAYDISNISGQYAVGSMVVFDNSFGEIASNKSEYRKFKIKTIAGADDTRMMREVLARRFRNNWMMPDVVFLDGGKGHLNMAEKLWKELGVGIPILAVAKGPTRKISNSQFLISKQFPPPAGGSKLKFHKQFSEILNNRNLIKRITDEAHRFAIFYHRKVRGKQFRLGG